MRYFSPSVFLPPCLCMSIYFCVCHFNLQVEETPLEEQKADVLVHVTEKLRGNFMESWIQVLKQCHWELCFSSFRQCFPLFWFYFLIFAAFTESGESYRVASNRTSDVSGRRKNYFPRVAARPRFEPKSVGMLWPQITKLDGRGSLFSRSKKLRGRGRCTVS